MVHRDHLKALQQMPTPSQCALSCIRGEGLIHLAVGVVGLGVILAALVVGVSDSPWWYVAAVAYGLVSAINSVYGVQLLFRPRVEYAWRRREAQMRHHAEQIEAGRG